MTRLVSSLMVLGVLAGGCGRRDADENEAATAAAGAEVNATTDDVAVQPVPPPTRLRAPLSVRRVRHRHAGPR